MKNRIGLFLTIITVFTFLSACEDDDDVQVYDLTDGLVAYYPFNGNANDESANSNDGTVNGATLTTDRAGNTNAAYSFDGIDDFIEVPHSSSLEFTDAFTLSTWIKPLSFNTTNCESNRIFEKSVDSQNGSWGLYFDDNLELNNCGQFNPQKMRYKTGFYQTDGTRKSMAGTSNIVLNHWQHVTSTYDGTRFVLYVNGREEFSLITDQAVANNTASLFIGKQNSSTFSFHTNAVIDEIRIYNRALEEEEIEFMMNAQ